MTISELIERLEALKAERGDLECHTYENISHPEEYVEFRIDLDPHWGVMVSVGKP